LTGCLVDSISLSINFFDSPKPLSELYWDIISDKSSDTSYDKSSIFNFNISIYFKILIK
jgi:hypothetical protein